MQLEARRSKPIRQRPVIDALSVERCDQGVDPRAGIGHAQPPSLAAGPCDEYLMRQFGDINGNTYVWWSRCGRSAGQADAEQADTNSIAAMTGGDSYRLCEKLEPVC